MSWMGAIYTDAEQLQEMVTAAVDLDPGELGHRLHEDGWVAPTVAGLARSLITEVMERTPHDEADKAQMERVISLLGTGN